MGQNQSQYLLRERVYPGWAFYLATGFIPLACAIILFAISVDYFLVTFLIVEATILTTSIITAPVISVTEESLAINSVSIPRNLVGSVSIVPTERGFAERGTELDPRAFLRLQVGVKELVKIMVLDPQDPTPYWLLSTRRGAELKSILNKVS